MKLDAFITLARSLMLENGVGYLDFGFHEYLDRPEVIGQTHFITGDNVVPLAHKITVSDEWVPCLTQDEARELMLHEIAHVKAGYKPTGGNHGPRWADECIKLGIKPKVKFNPAHVPLRILLDTDDARV